MGDLPRLRGQLAFGLTLLGVATYAVLTVVALASILATGRVEMLVLDLAFVAWGVALLVWNRPPLVPRAATVIPPLVLVVSFFYATLGPGEMRPALSLTVAFAAGALGGVRAVLWATGTLAAAVVALYALIPPGYPPWSEALAQPLSTRAALVVKTFSLAAAVGLAVASVIGRMSRTVRAGAEVNSYYKLLAEHASDVVWTADLTLRNTYMSPSIERLRGYTQEEIRAQPIEERVLEPSLSAARDILGQRMALLQQGDPRGWEPALFDLVQPHKRGGTVITSNHVRLVPGPDGRPASLVGVSRDVTALRKAQRRQRLQVALAARAAESTSVSETARAGLDALLELAGWEDGALLTTSPAREGGPDEPGVACAALTPGLGPLLGGQGPLTADTPAGEALLGMLGKAPTPSHAPDGAPDGAPREVATHEHELAVSDPTGRAWALTVLPLAPGPEPVGYVVFARGRGGARTEPLPDGLDELSRRVAQHLTHNLARAHLGDSERRYRALTESSLDAIMRLDTTGRYLYANPAVRTLTGLAPEHFVGKTLATVGLPRKLRAAFEAILARTLASGDASQLTYYVPGTKRWVDMQVVPERDAAGQIVSVITASRDVTTRKRAEDALQASEVRYRTLFEAANDGLLLLAPPERGGTFLAANPRAGDLLGGPPEALVGKTPGEISPPTQPDGRTSPAAARQHLDAVMAGAPQTFQWRHRGLTGADIDVEVTLHRVDLPDGTAIQVSLRDLTDTKRAQVALAREAQFRAILGDIANDFIRLPVGEFDAGVKRALAAIGGALGARCAVLMERNANAARFEPRQRWLAGGVTSCGGAHQLVGEGLAVGEGLEPETYELLMRLETVTRSRGGSKAGTLVLEPLASQGACVGVLAFRFGDPERRLTEPEGKLVMLTAATLATTLERQRVEDERRRLDAQIRQTQKLEAVGLLAGGIAHDFNNLLCAIGGTAELLADDAERGTLSAESTTTMTQEITAATERAAALTRQLLAFSRQDRARAEDVPVGRALAALHQMLRRVVGENILLTVEAQGDAGAVRIDPTQLDQVLLNLAVNARDAMPQGGRLEIEARAMELDAAACASRALRPGSHVVISVKDTGSGMTPEVQERAFDPFFTTKDVGKGTGLGLSTVHGIVERAQGHVEIQSSPGEGTTFWLYFPQVPAPSVSAPKEDAAGSTITPSPPGRSRGTILLVEDAPDVRALAAGFLRRLGYEVVQASGPRQALRLLGEDGTPRVDLLFTDVVMPHMNGRELAHAARALFPELAVLFTSGYTRNVLAGAEELGEEVHFLPKPYSFSVLSAAVREAMGR